MERGREHSLGEEGEWLAAVHPGVNLFSELLSLTVSGQLLRALWLRYLISPTPRMLHFLMQASTYNPSGISQINPPPSRTSVYSVIYVKQSGGIRSCPQSLTGDSFWNLFAYNLGGLNNREKGAL